MKTLFNKRRFLAALSAALLISAALIVGCMNEFDGQNKPDDNVIIPKGKGLLRLNFANNSARTIFPSSLPDVADMVYDIQISPRTTGTNDASLTKVSSTVAQTAILLTADTYDITITAWDSTETDALAGWKSPLGPGGGVTIGSTSKTVPVNLIGWTDDGAGTFKYNITVPPLPTGWALTAIPGAYTPSKLEIYKSDGTTLVTNQADAPTNTEIGTAGVISLAVGSNPGNLTLAAGYYIVKVTLQATNCQDRVVSSVLHIYNTMESDWGTVTVPALNQEKFTFKFNINLGTFIPDSDSTYLNDGSVTVIGGDDTDYSGRDTQLLNFLAPVLSPGVPSCATHTFGGWFTTATPGGSDTALTLSTLQVFRDTNLYAKWTENSSPGLTIEITFGVTDGNLTATPSTGITYTGLTGSQSVTLTLSSPVGDPYTSVAWDMDGITLSDSTAATLTIDKNFSQLNRLVSGSHVINAVGTRANGQTFSGSIPITIAFTAP
jgi:hypothetical protein